MERISSRKNPLCLQLRKLAADGKYRREIGRFLCDSPEADGGSSPLGSGDGGCSGDHAGAGFWGSCRPLFGRWRCRRT